jgi:hypothetical protein
MGSLIQAPPPPPALTRYQDTHPWLTYAGAWSYSTTSSASGGSFRYLDKTGSASITFDGTSFNWVARKSPSYGIAKVTVDGGEPLMVDLYSATSDYAKSVWDTGTLDAGTHTVTIEWTGEKNSAATGTNISLDAVDVLGKLVRPAGLVRVEQTDSRLTYAGTWSTFSATGASAGSYRRADTSGASLTVKFTGTYLSWIATAGTTLSKAYVSLDGGAAQSIDLARSAVAYQQSVWTTGVVTEGQHTVKIWWDTANAVGKYISIDAFDVVGTLDQAPSTQAVRYEQNNTYFVYAGTWTPSSSTSASAGSFRFANQTGSSVTVKFTGTYLAWIAKKSPVYGQAKVTLDSGTPVTIDLYSADTLWKQKVWETGPLSAGPHTVKIEWTGKKIAAATDTNISVDAFDVIGTLN